MNALFVAQQSGGASLGTVLGAFVLALTVVLLVLIAQWLGGASKRRWCATVYRRRW